jgi:hypothetical protein
VWWLVGSNSNSLQEETFFNSFATVTALLADSEGWAPVSNLDVFFTRMYNFYFDGGFSVIVAKRVTNLMYVRSSGPDQTPPPSVPLPKKPVVHGLQGGGRRLAAGGAGLLCPRVTSGGNAA